MQWEIDNHGHDCFITEVMENGGVTSLKLTCNTCNQLLGMLDRADQPKYRLAYATLREIATEHSEQPLDTLPTRVLE